MRVSVSLLLAFAGCLAPMNLLESNTGAEFVEIEHDVVAENCFTAVVFFLISPELAKAYLPPGFHSENLRQFIYYTPAFADNTAFFAATQTCEFSFHYERNSGNESARQSSRESFFGFFVKEPLVDFDQISAQFNFYVLEWHSDVNVDWFKDFGWNAVETDTRLNIMSYIEEDIPDIPDFVPAPARPSEMTMAIATGSIGNQPWFEFEAYSGYPLAIDENPVLRFWHYGARGLGYVEHRPEFDTLPASNVQTCEYAPDSLLAEVLIDRTPDQGCMPENSFHLTFPAHDLYNGTMFLREGVYW